MKSAAIGFTCEDLTRIDQRSQHLGNTTPHALLERRPLSAIVSLAAPTTAVMLVAAASNVFHTFFVSRLGPESIAAVALVFPISLVVMTVVAGGMGTGVASAIARTLGAGQAPQARAVAEHALLIAALLAIVGTAGLELWADDLFRAMGGKGEVLRQATLFARALFAGLAISFAASTFDSMMRGEGNVRIPAICASLSLSLQVGLTPLFMFTAGLGLVGAPIAALVSQLIGTVPRAVYVFGGYGVVCPRIFPRRIEMRHFAEILRVGVPAALSAVVNFTALIVLTAVLAGFGDAALAAYGLGTRLGFLLFALGFGSASATVTLVGMATGAGRTHLVKRYVARAVLLVAGVVAVPALLVFAHPPIWLSIFTDDPGIQSVGAEFFHVIAPSYVVAVSGMVFASAFQGLGRATIPLAVIAVRVTLVLAVVILLTRQFSLGPRAVFFVIAIGNVLSATAIGLLFWRALRVRRDAAN